MSNEDKMREAFVNWWLYRKPRHNWAASETEAWIIWKASAAIKDAEIADITKRKDAYFLEMCEVIDKNELLLEEIASRDLMIKELREIIAGNSSFLTACKMSDSVQIDFNNEALANSEYHNSRALEKMLLEARIGMLNAVSGRKLHGGVMHTREYVNGYNAKVAQTNKLLQELQVKLAELNKE